jgi:predicted negative regulator of RcsB-dependent stress response
MVVIHKKKIETPEEKEARKLQEQERSMGIQDEYQAKGFEFMSWVQHNKSVVLGLVALIIAVGVGFGAYSFYQRRLSEQASSAYIEIVRKFESPTEDKTQIAEKYKDGQKELAELISKFKNTKVATLAKLWAGHLALQANDAPASVAFYQQALKSIASKDELYPLVLIGLGYAEESNGQKAEALSRFSTVADLKNNSAGKELALLEAGRLAKDINEPEKAKTFATRLIEEFPGSMYEKNAKRLRDSL